MMAVKLNRGPMKNKRVTVQDSSCYEYRIREAKPMEFDRLNGWSKDRFAYDAKIEFREGSYRKSNVRLKDGTVVFEWMGWYE